MSPEEIAAYAAVGALMLTAALVYFAHRTDEIAREIRDLLRRLLKQ